MSPLMFVWSKMLVFFSLVLMEIVPLCFSENHNNKIQNFMLDVMCPIIQEGDSVPQELLDTVLMNIIEPQKVNPLILTLNLLCLPRVP